MCAFFTDVSEEGSERNECANHRYVQRPAEAEREQKLTKKQHINDKPKVTPNPTPQDPVKKTLQLFI